jgi:2-deoxy-D-gluconate 3-dehydrogenase
MDNSLDGRIAVVTGSRSGIGQGMAIAVSEAGADVVVTDLRDGGGASQTGAAVRHGWRPHAEPETGRVSRAPSGPRWRS